MKVIARISPGPGGAGGEQVGDPVGQDPGLARAGAGEDQQRPLAVLDRLALGRVEPRQQPLDAVGAGLGRGAAGGAESASGGVSNSL